MLLKVPIIKCDTSVRNDRGVLVTNCFRLGVLASDTVLLSSFSLVLQCRVVETGAQGCCVIRPEVTLRG